jgi:hypothetical protein
MSEAIWPNIFEIVGGTVFPFFATLVICVYALRALKRAGGADE